MKTTAHSTSAVRAILVGLGSAVIIYYLCTAIPPGSLLPLSSEVTSTSRSNVEFRPDTSGNAEVMYYLQVGHSLPMIGLSLLAGFVIAAILFVRGRARQDRSQTTPDTQNTKEAEQVGDGDAEEAV